MIPDPLAFLEPATCHLSLVGPRPFMGLGPVRNKFFIGFFIIFSRGTKTPSLGSFAFLFHLIICIIILPLSFF